MALMYSTAFAAEHLGTLGSLPCIKYFEKSCSRHKQPARGILNSSHVELSKASRGGLSNSSHLVLF